ncbi:unnamed protein product [Amoebophrya sp. A25]|nr:unnamed protein product [Amoebophrya sp. A25]|eukprot:GSA25T00016461001.1
MTISVYGSSGFSSERPATAPGGNAKVLMHGMGSHISASSNTATRKCAPDVDFQTIVALSKQFTEELELKNAEKTALVKIIQDAKKAVQKSEAVVEKKKAQLDKASKDKQDVDRKVSNLEEGNTKLRHELAGLLRENEKLALEVETMSEQMKELLLVFGEHKEQLEAITTMTNTYRREIGVEKKHRDEVLAALRTHKTARNILKNRVADAARRQQLLKTHVADLFVASAG